MNIHLPGKPAIWLSAIGNFSFLTRYRFNLVQLFEIVLPNTFYFVLKQLEMMLPDFDNIPVKLDKRENFAVRGKPFERQNGNFSGRELKLANFAQNEFSQPDERNLVLAKTDSRVNIKPVFAAFDLDGERLRTRKISFAEFDLLGQIASVFKLFPVFC